MLCAHASPDRALADSGLSGPVPATLRNVQAAGFGLTVAHALVASKRLESTNSRLTRTSTSSHPRGRRPLGHGAGCVNAQTPARRAARDCSYTKHWLGT